MIGDKILCIAGKNQCSIDFVNFVIKKNKITKNILICPNDSDDGKNGWQPSLRKFAKSKNLKIVNLNKLYKIKNLIFVSIEYEKIIDIDKFVSKNLYNFHFSLLPKYRGCHTNFFQIYKNEKNLGVTLHKIDQGIDTGPIASSLSYKYNLNDNAKDNYIKLMNCSVNLFKKEYQNIVDSKFFFTKQNLKKGSYYSRKAVNYDKIKFIKNFKSNLTTYNKIRSLIFPPFQYPIINGKEIKKATYKKGKIHLKFI